MLCSVVDNTEVDEGNVALVHNSPTIIFTNAAWHQSTDCQLSEILKPPERLKHMFPDRVILVMSNVGLRLTKAEFQRLHFGYRHEKRRRLVEMLWRLDENDQLGKTGEFGEIDMKGRCRDYDYDTGQM